MKKIICCLLVSWFIEGPTVSAETPTRLTGSVTADGVIGLIDRSLYFVGTDVAHGAEIWQTDGTVSGTKLFVDVTTGSGGTTYRLPGTSYNGGMLVSPRVGINNSYRLAYMPAAGSLRIFHELTPDFAIYNNRVYANGVDDAGNEQLWLTDGDFASTKPLDNLLGDTIINPSWLLTLPGRGVVFLGNSSQYDRALYLTDGTAVKTSLLHGFNYSQYLNTSEPIGPLHGKLFYPIGDATEGLNLWETDGTPEGTKLLIDLDTNPNSYTGGRSYCHAKAMALTYFTFIGDDGIHGKELWRSDGTKEGTSLLRDINTDPASFINGGSGLLEVVAINDSVFFTARQHDYGELQLWRTDGSSDGTIQLKTLNAEEIAAKKNVNGLVPVRGRLYFSAPYGPSMTYVLWVTDGTLSGTHVLDPNSTIYNPIVYGTVNGFLLFAGTPGENPRFLYEQNLSPWVESIAPVANSPTSAAEAEFLVSFDETVRGVDPSDFVLVEDGTVGARVLAADTADGGYNWTVRIDTGQGDGAIRLELVDDDSVVDMYASAPLEGYGFDTDGSFTGEIPLLVDKPPPSVRLTANVPDPVRHAYVRVTATFDHEVTGFALEDLLLTNATAKDLSGALSSYTFTVVAQAPGEVRVQVAEEAAQDGGGLPSALSPVLSWQYEPGIYHSADFSRDYLITLSELLLLIQFYNIGGFHCAVSGPDPFSPGADSSAENCTRHDSDYSPYDWHVGLSELLRLIQFYNSGGYHPCPDAPTNEDGFCPGIL